MPVNHRERKLEMDRMRANFTLIELLIVIAIIAILASLLLPALNKARSKAKVTLCQNNQRQLYTALLQYTGDWKGYLPGTQWDAEYAVTVNPYLREQNESPLANSRYFMRKTPSGIFYCPEYKPGTNPYYLPSYTPTAPQQWHTPTDPKRGGWLLRNPANISSFDPTPRLFHTIMTGSIIFGDGYYGTTSTFESAAVNKCYILMTNFSSIYFTSSYSYGWNHSNQSSGNFTSVSGAVRTFRVRPGTSIFDNNFIPIR